MKSRSSVLSWEQSSEASLGYSRETRAKSEELRTKSREMIRSLSLWSLSSSNSFFKFFILMIFLSSGLGLRRPWQLGVSLTGQSDDLEH